MLGKYGLMLLAGALVFVAATLLPVDMPAGGPSTTKASHADDTAASYAELALPNVLPAKAELGLQLGLFLDASQAARLAAQATSLGEKTRLLAVTDPNGARWQLLVAGPYATLDQAHARRLPLRHGLGLDNAPAVLLLPPPKKPPKN